MNNYFYQGMSQEAYNDLLKDGERLYVPDREAIALLELEKSKELGIPVTAHLSTGSDGVTVWQLIPAAESAAQKWSYVIQPTRDGQPIVMKFPQNKGIYYVCLFDELHTVREETEFRYLMAVSGMDDDGKEGRGDE